MPAIRVDSTMRIFWRIHRAVLRATGGRFGGVGPLPALLLTTRGRKTGEPRDVTLNYVRHGGAFVVVASYGGEDRDPAWWKNLRDQPDAEVSVGGKRSGR